MLLRHSAIYLVARGVPGLLGLVAIVIFTRMLSAKSYGEYSLVVAGSVIVNSICYQWISAALNRFLPQYQSNEKELLAAVFHVFLMASVIIGFCGVLLLIYVWGNEGIRWLVFLGVLLTWAHAWFTLSIELARSRLSPIRYGVISACKSVVFLTLSVILIYNGYKSYGAILGLTIGLFAAATWAMRGEWASIRGIIVNKALVKNMLVYGAPLIASFAFTTTVSTSDKIMLAWFVDESATGLYTAGQGLVQQSISILMMLVHLAAYPLIVRSLENEGEIAARTQLRNNVNLLIGVGAPVTVICFMLATEVSHIFLGEGYRESASELIPWFSLAALLAGLRAYHFDIAFYLGERTKLHVVVMGGVASINLILNYMLIPIYGVIGAVYASVVAHGVAVVMSAVLGGRVFCMPNILGDVTRLLLSALIMAVALYFIPNDSFYMLALSTVTGVLVYGVSVFIFSPCNVRKILMQKFYRQRLISACSNSKRDPS
ncbi:MAG TPA: polysaccharide biosynthesis protein [Thiothrix sp.]|nr:polysaccharide biosynthesis protein [Thiothrix sp.]